MNNELTNGSRSGVSSTAMNDAKPDHKSSEASADIEMAIADADIAVLKAIHLFLKIAADSETLTLQISSIETPSDEYGARDKALAGADSIRANVADIVVAFQFYDMLRQRLICVLNDLNSRAEGSQTEEDGTAKRSLWTTSRRFESDGDVMTFLPRAA